MRSSLLYALAAIAVIAPIGAASWLAVHESRLREQDRAGAVALDLLQHSDKIAEQLTRVLVALKVSPSPEPCSDENAALMRSLVIKSNLLIDVGYVQADELVCSAFGHDNVPIGPPTYTSNRGNIVRVGVEHRLAPDTPLIIVTDAKTGYTAIVSQALMIDTVPEERNLSAGVIGLSSGAVVAGRGFFNPQWLRRADGAYDMTFDDGSNIVAWKRSDRADLAAFAAVGLNRVAQGQRQILLIIMPVGIAAAALLFYAMLRLVRLQTSMPSLLKAALKNGKEFFLVYHPIVDLRTGHWHGAEALLRWRRPNGEIIVPDIFIPIAERNHLMERLTSAVLDLFEAEAKPLLHFIPGFHIALNLSADDFCHPRIIDKLRAMPQRLRIPPGTVYVEVTERLLMNIDASRRNLQLLRAAGIRIAIDDFGTGYSSLAYLNTLDADWLKIDKTFVDTIGTQAVTSEVIRHIIEMAGSLNMEMVAEGVETIEQAQYLREHGVEYAQGWLFAKPMSMEDLLQQATFNAAASASMASVVR